MAHKPSMCGLPTKAHKYHNLYETKHNRPKVAQCGNIVHFSLETPLGDNIEGNTPNVLIILYTKKALRF